MTLARECVYAEEILGRPTLRAWMFNILGPGGPVPLLLDSTKQRSVAMQVVNNASTLCRKEQNEKHSVCFVTLTGPGGGKSKGNKLK